MDVNVWSQQLIAQLRGHMDGEREALTRYAELADEARKHIRLLEFVRERA